MADMLLFDGDCGFCTSSARLAQRLAPSVTVVPYQRADLSAYDLTPEQCKAALQWIGTGGPASGAPAVARLLRASRGAWPLAGRCLELPILRSLAAFVYRRVAANRRRLPGGTPACRL